jgi:hypothetical protein
MFAQDLHVPLAFLTMLAVVVATLEGAVRAVRARPAGVAAERTRTAVVLAVAMTAAVGVALLVGGHHPKEWLHLIYAALAFSLVPVADNAGTILQSVSKYVRCQVFPGFVTLTPIDSRGYRGVGGVLAAS